MQSLQSLASLNPQSELQPGTRLVLVFSIFDVNPLLPDEVEARARAELEIINDELDYEAPGWQLVLTGYEQSATTEGTTEAQLRVRLLHVEAGMSASMFSSTLVALEPVTITAALVWGAMALGGIIAGAFIVDDIYSPSITDNAVEVSANEAREAAFDSVWAISIAAAIIVWVVA